MDAAVIDLGPSMFEDGMAYVAPSRVCTLDSFALLDLVASKIKASAFVQQEMALNLFVSAQAREGAALVEEEITTFVNSNLDFGTGVKATTNINKFLNCKHYIYKAISSIKLEPQEETDYNGTSSSHDFRKWYIKA